MIYSFAVVIIGLYMSSTVILWNMCRGHIWSGYTKIERKYRLTHKQNKVPNPFNRGICQNMLHTFGNFGPGWLLPLPTSFYEGNIKQMYNDWDFEDIVI